MARRSLTSSEPKHADLTVEAMSRGIERLQKRLQEVEAFDSQNEQERFNPRVSALNTSIQGSLASVFGEGTVEFNRYHRKCEIHPGSTMLIGFGHEEPIQKIQSDIERARQSSLTHLRQVISFLEEEVVEKSKTAGFVPRTSPKKLSNKVFVIHGHDVAALQIVARFLEKLGLEAIILNEQPNQGKTIIEKFEDCASEVGFAVVLLTPDDLAAAVGATQISRARQNVIFELGYFAGKLGRGKACLLRRGDMEIPSDLYGVIYTELDPHDGWKGKLVRELKAAKLDFDANKAWT